LISDKVFIILYCTNKSCNVSRAVEVLKDEDGLTSVLENSIILLTVLVPALGFGNVESYTHGPPGGKFVIYKKGIYFIFIE
jgi:hypothetical protein